jgi:quercetin dioxygenase-like cupin family protein
MQMTTLVVPPREGKAVSLGGFGAIFKISGDSSEGRFSIVEHPIDPGRMVHPHVHAHEDEFSYILEGEIGARIGDEVLQATTGSYVFKPRGLPHTFWNATRSLPDCSNLSRPQALKSISPNWPTCCGRAAMSIRSTI